MERTLASGDGPVTGIAQSDAMPNADRGSPSGASVVFVIALALASSACVAAQSPTLDPAALDVHLIALYERALHLQEDDGPARLTTAAHRVLAVSPGHSHARRLQEYARELNSWNPAPADPPAPTPREDEVRRQLERARESGNAAAVGRLGQLGAALQRLRENRHILARYDRSRARALLEAQWRKRVKSWIQHRRREVDSRETGSPVSAVPTLPARYHRLLTECGAYSPEWTSDELRAAARSAHIEAAGTPDPTDTSLEGAQAMNALLEAEIMALLSRLKLWLPTTRHAPRIHGQVTAVAERGHRAVLNVGEGNGVRVGVEFTVYRGDRYVARVRVIRVEANRATARLICASSKSGVLPGDDASTIVQ